MPFDSASDDASVSDDATVFDDAIVSDDAGDALDSLSLATLGWDTPRAAELAALSSARGAELIPARVARVDRGALTVLTGFLRCVYDRRAGCSISMRPAG